MLRPSTPLRTRAQHGGRLRQLGWFGLALVVLALLWLVAGADALRERCRRRPPLALPLLGGSRALMAPRRRRFRSSPRRSF